MSPSPEQVNLPLKIEEKKTYLTAEEMHRIWKDKKAKRLSGKEEKSSVPHESKEEVSTLWGPVFYPLPGQYRRDTDTAERVPVCFGNDLNWYVGGKIVSDIYALEIIENNEDREDYDEIVKKIEKLKELKK